MPRPPRRVHGAAARRRALAAICLAAAAIVWQATAAVAQDAGTPAASRPVPATPGNLSREEKRCASGVRRVERQKEKLAETRRALDANRAAAATCGDPRACERTAHRGKSLEARAHNEERQLGRLEAEAQALCDAATAAAGRTKAR